MDHENKSGILNRISSMMSSTVISSGSDVISSTILPLVRKYPHYDQVGSLRAISDSSGTVVKQIDYDSFGNVISDTNISMTSPFGFAGGLYDHDTGLVRFGFRDYDPAIGRWTAKDPIDFSGRDVNLYGYVFSNAISSVDPNGTVIFNVWAAIVGAGAGGVSNAIAANSNGNSWSKGFLTGAAAGALAGITLNPFAMGAIIGGANEFLNVQFGLTTHCEGDSVKEYAKAIGFGALVGGIAGKTGRTLFEAKFPAAPSWAGEVFQALGETIGAVGINNLEAYLPLISVE